MAKKHLQKLCLILISGFIAVSVTILACSGGDWTGYEGSMFTPEIISQPKYTPFFRTQATSFYDGYDDKSADIFKEENSKEWISYLSSSISKEAVNYWLYEASLNQVDSMIFDIKKKPANLTAKSISYSLKSVQPDTKAISFLYYLGFAKRNENFAVNAVNSWDEQKKIEKVDITKQITGGINFLAKATDPFMKERYAFQLERLYFFNKDYDKVIKTYTENEANFKSEKNLKWRALSYEAGAFYRQKKYAQANYLFSKIYDQFDPLQKSAYLSFHPQQQSDWNACLALAKTTREKEVLWQLFGLYADNVTAMKEILKLNPKSELAELLLVRAINMEEEKFNGILNNNTKNKEKLLAGIDNSLVTFLNEMSQSNTSNNPVIWQLAAAYINYIKKDYSNADKQLKLAEKNSKASSLINLQYHLISLVGKITRVTELNPKVENDLLPDLKAILSKDKKDASFRADYGIFWIRATLADMAKKKGENEKAEIINHGIDNARFENIENLKTMIAYCNKDNKSEFEKLFFDVAPLNAFDYTELLAIRYAQKDQLEDALRAFKSIPKHNNILPGNPFTIRIRDCHDCDHEAKQKTKYSSISFVEKMIEMKGFAASKPAEAAQNYFLVANGFYNMTYFGNARYFYDNKVNNDGYYFDVEAHNPEMNCELALKYYLLAKQSSNDAEMQAKCTFMAAKCEQNKFFMNKPKDYDGDFKSGEYFALLKKNYAATKYYSEILKECSYYKLYAGK